MIEVGDVGPSAFDELSDIASFPPYPFRKRFLAQNGQRF